MIFFGERPINAHLRELMTVVLLGYQSLLVCSANHDIYAVRIQNEH